MELHADLHAHSAFAGGARAGGKSPAEQEKKIHQRFLQAAVFAPLKGIQFVGTGDVQYAPWLHFLEQHTHESYPGIYRYAVDSQELTASIIAKDKNLGVYYSQLESIPTTDYVLQTELIFTGPVPNSKKRKTAHVVITFPDFTRVHELNELLDAWGVARQNMPRPFVVSQTVEEIAAKVHAILDLDPFMEFIPAHIMTPDGIFGGSNRINQLSDFFGSASERFSAVETGLSADPKVLGVIPELDSLTLISNADAHSSTLNRIGREFTSYELQKPSYANIITALRNNHVIKTAEFHPTEGRYFLTGHRENRQKPAVHAKGQYCYFSPRHVPANDICPICKKPLTVGVLQRAYEISHAQGSERVLGDGPQRPYVTMVPLIEIVAFTRGIKSVASKTVLKDYVQIMQIIGNEALLWTHPETLSRLQESSVDPQLVQNIVEVANGNFAFMPAGYDGTYGKLQIGVLQNYEEINTVHNS